MAVLAGAALIVCILSTIAHLVSAALAMSRLALPRSRHRRATEPVTIIRPVCGLDPYDDLTLRSTFNLKAGAYEVIFCAAREGDAAAPLVRRLIAQHPHIPARLLIGDERQTLNPKLNNIIKGWAAARYRWIVIADNNVLMPPHYLDTLFSSFGPDTGLVCSPPIGSRPDGLWAEVECAFLNTYQARWQYAADRIGFGFAQGKSMLWRRDVLEDAGGIEALGAEIAEDAAATKIVRAHGLRVRLVDRPFEQPLGVRSIMQVWNRQVRWARLRRATFPALYACELLSGSVVSIASGVFAAHALGSNPVAVFAALLLIWFGTEALLARAARWHIGILSPLAWAVRDLLLPALWLQGWAGNKFVWRGNDMSVAACSVAPGCDATAKAAASA